jgi:Lamin Tail Domain
MKKLDRRLVIAAVVTMLGAGAACSDDDSGNGLCGNGVLDDGEVCDTINLAGQSCADMGNYTGGTLACANDCTAYDTTACTVPVDCGNGLLNAGEECDDTNLDNTQCQDLVGFTGGTLACANDCSFDTTDCVVGIGPGSIVITEIMANPGGVADVNGEWFEVHNNTNTSIDLNGWFLASSDDGTHLINAGGALDLPAGGYLVFGVNDVTAENGGVDVDYVFSGLTLGNSSDDIAVQSPDAVVIDVVVYDATNFPLQPGHALSLDPTATDAVANDTGANWCTSSARLGLDWDQGSPGAANPSCTPESDCDDLADNDGNGATDCADTACAYDAACTSAAMPGAGDLIITELMVTLTGVDDGKEWVELHNPTSGAVECNGLEVCDDNNLCVVLSFGASFALAAGGYALLAASDVQADNGGIPAADVDYVYGPLLQLSATTDTLSLYRVSGQTRTLVDQVAYNESNGWPVSDDTALQLDAAVSQDETTNDAPGNWCLSTQTYGSAGLLGTPGAANQTCAIPPTGLLFSEYVEGSSNNKAIEIYNYDTTSAALVPCQVEIYANGNPTPSFTKPLGPNTLAPDDVFVLCDDDFDAANIGLCDLTASGTFWNGNDAVALVCGGVLLDVIGQIGVNPGSAWTGGGVSTSNDTMRRLCTVSVGDTDGSDVFDPSVEWTSAGNDVFTDLGQHCP